MQQEVLPPLMPAPPCDHVSVFDYVSLTLELLANEAFLVNLSLSGLKVVAPLPA